jgi:hypothetical protein
MSALPDGPGPLNPAAYYGPLFNVVEETSAFSDAPAPTVALNAIINFAARYGNIGCLDLDNQCQSLRMFGIVIGPTVKGRKTSSAQLVGDLFEAVDLYSSSFVALAESSALAGIQRLGSIASGEGIIRPMYQGDERRLLLRLDSMNQFVKMAERNGNYARSVINRAFDSGVIDAGGWNPMILNDAHLCILAHATAEDMRAARTERVLGVETLARFIPIYSEVSKRQKPNFKGWPDDRREFLARLILANVAALTGGERVAPGAPPLFHHAIHPEALALWDTLRRLPEAFPFEDTPARAYAARLGHNGQRLACLLAAMNGERVVRLGAVEAATAWVDYACRSLDHVFGEQHHRAHRYRLEAVGLRMVERVQRVGVVSARELVQWVARKGTVTSATAYEAIRLMLCRGRLVESSDRTGQRGPKTIHLTTAPENSFPQAFPPQNRNDESSRTFHC